MPHKTDAGTIDPHGYLASGQVEAWLGEIEPDEDAVETINDAIDEWTEADPDGYDETAARELDEKVADALRESVARAAKS